MPGTQPLDSFFSTVPVATRKNKGTSPAASFRVLSQAVQITSFVLSTARCYAMPYEWLGVTLCQW